MTQRRTTFRKSRSSGGAFWRRSARASEPEPEEAIFEYIRKFNINKVLKMMDEDPNIIHITLPAEQLGLMKYKGRNVTPVEYAFAKDIRVTEIVDKAIGDRPWNNNPLNEIAYSPIIIDYARTLPLDNVLKTGFDINENRPEFGVYKTFFNKFIFEDFKVIPDYDVLEYLVDRLEANVDTYMNIPPDLYNDDLQDDEEIPLLMALVLKFIKTDDKKDGDKFLELIKYGADQTLRSEKTRRSCFNFIVETDIENFETYVDPFIIGRLINDHEEGQKTPLIIAIDAADIGNQEKAIYLVENGADVNIPFVFLGLEVKFTQYPIHSAAEKYIDLLYLDHDEDVDLKKYEIMATFRELFKALIEHGADINEIADTEYNDGEHRKRRLFQMIAVRTYDDSDPKFDSREEEEEYHNLLKLLADNGISMIDPNTGEDTYKEHRETLIEEAKIFFDVYFEYEEPKVVKLWKGFSYEDVEKFKDFLKAENELDEDVKETLKNYSFCPVCLDFVIRQDGCMYMTHGCNRERRNNDIYKKFSDSNRITWCTYCGRACKGHRHIARSVLPDIKGPIPLAEELSTENGDFRFFDKDCLNSGGGGSNEKKQRILSLLKHACIMQENVDNFTYNEVRNIIIEGVWNDATEEVNLSGPQEFDFSCFPSESAGPKEEEPEEVIPDVNRPADEKDLVPIKHDNGDCIIEGGPHDDHRPTWEFVHKQPDGSVYHHTNYICGEDLEEFLKTRGPQDANFGMCWEPTACRARLYPEEIKDIVSAPFYDVYKRNFNSRFSEQKGGATENFLYPVEMDTALCAGPNKKHAGKRRVTYRKRRATFTTRNVS
jgi:hypothetical protein